VPERRRAKRRVAASAGSSPPGQSETLAATTTTPVAGSWARDPDLAGWLASIRGVMVGGRDPLPHRGAAGRCGDTPDRRLQERIKELVCLYGVTELVLHYGSSVEAVLQGIVDLLPSALQHPRAASAQLHLAEQVYRSAGWHEPTVSLTRAILVTGERVGMLQVGYAVRPAGPGEPFLEEERLLLGQVAEHAGLVIARDRAEQAVRAARDQLEVEHRALLEANIALRALTEQLHSETATIGETIRENLNRTVLPLLDGLARDLPANRSGHLTLLRRCLDDLVSPFLARLRTATPDLTPTELAICVMIRRGLTSKEIAEIRGITVGTVSRHRENIRRRLGLTGAGKNLTPQLPALELG